MFFRIGIEKGDYSWKHFLQQEGIPYCEIDPGQNINPEEITVYLPGNSSPLPDSSVLDYLDQGGTVIMTARLAAEFFRLRTGKRKYTFRFSDPDSIFGSVGLVDFCSFRKMNLPGEKWEVLDDSLGISALNYGRGRILSLPFEPADELINTKVVRKKFPADRDEYPSEKVARISRGQIRKIIRISLEYLSHWRGIPFIQLWYYPLSARNIFIFRLDTDFCNSQEARDIYDLCRDHDIRATWFIDTGSQLRLEQDYSKFTDHEIGFHCQRHRLFHDLQKDAFYIDQGLERMQAAGIIPRGYAAPFGDWYPELAALLAERDFCYSSEFAISYDDLPAHYPALPDSTSLLQIPVHPVSPGRLRRSHFSVKQMTEYFAARLDEKLITGDPVIFYHHPHHQLLQVISNLFIQAKMKNILNLTMLELARWWKIRNRQNLDCKIDDVLLQITGLEPDERFSLRISTPNGDVICKAEKQINLSKIKFAVNMETYSLKPDVKLRRLHWRDLLYDYESLRGKLRQ